MLRPEEGQGPRLPLQVHAECLIVAQNVHHYGKRWKEGACHVPVGLSAYLVLSRPCCWPKAALPGVPPPTFTSPMLTPTAINTPVPK
jgi:hypothetical protein